MRRAAGQGARLAGARLHLLAQIVLAALVVLLACAAVLAWRLDQGPVALPWLAHRIEAAAQARGIPLSVHEASLEWRGFSRGLGQPLRLALTGLQGAAGDGPAPVQVRRVAAEFAIGPLLTGHFVPYGITVEGVRATLTRGPHGTLMLGSQPHPGPALEALPRGAAKPGGGPSLNWRDLHHLHVHDVSVSLYDAQIGLPWRIERADADFDRAADGAVQGHATVAVAAGPQRATLTLNAAQDRQGSVIGAKLTPLDPAALAPLAAAFAPLGMLDAPVSLTADAALDAAFGLRRAHLTAAIGPGTIHAGTGTAPVVSATLVASAGPAALDATLHIVTAAGSDRPQTAIDSHLSARLAAGLWHASVQGSVDRVAFADLPALWPAGTGGPGSRPWITANITAGEATGGRLALALEAPADLSDVRLVSIDAAIDAHDLTVHWLRPVPPLEHAEGRLTVTDPDVIDIAVSAARQRRPAGGGGGPDGIAFSNGLVHLTGIAGHDQFADIRTDLAGQLPDLIAVLKNPKVKLLDKRPVPMRDPAGQFTAHLTVQRLPLRDNVAMEDLQIATKGHFTAVHLGGIAAGRSLDDGVLDLAADNNGLSANGSANLAGIPAQLQVAMDFRAGPPSQIEQQVEVKGTVDQRQIAALGLNTRGVLGGGVALDATLRSRRDGQSDIAATANLLRASIDMPRFGYSKPEGQPVQASLHATLDHDRLVSVDQVQVHGPGIDIEGGADFAGGQPQVLRMSRIVLASTTDPRATDLQAVVRLPLQTGDAYGVDLSGASLDATGVLGHEARPKQQPAPPKGPGPPWTVQARLGRVILGTGRLVTQLDAHVENDGQVVRAASLSGIAQSVTQAGRQRPSPFRLTITPEAGGRRLAASAPDAGGLLRVLDVADDISGGRMTVAARYDDRAPGHPLSGTAELHDFRVLDAPVIGRVLQAATLYGLIEVLRGPGLGFATMIAPFRLQDDVLSLSDARAFSASLGFTAKGSVDLAARSLDMAGTIVPAYALNTLPGRIPLLGKLFSPERGGGLFAATYHVSGPLDNPKVGVNPLATLTPGFLRGLFGIFGKGGR